MDEQMINRIARAIESPTGNPDTFGGKVSPTALRDARIAHSVMAGKVAEQQQRLEAAFVKGADIAVFIANQRQNPQPPTASQLDEIADFLAAVRGAL